MCIIYNTSSFNISITCWTKTFRFSELQQRIEELEKENSERYDKMYSLESNLGLSKAECKDLQAELTVINQVLNT